MTYLVELGPCRPRERAAAAGASAVAAAVARLFGRRRTASPLVTPSSLEALARRRLGLVRFTRPRS